MLARFRRDPAFPDTGPAEPPGELLELRACNGTALGHLDHLLSLRPSREVEDALLEVRSKLAPAKAGSSLLRPHMPVSGGAS